MTFLPFYFLTAQPGHHECMWNAYILRKKVFNGSLKDLRALSFLVGFYWETISVRLYRMQIKPERVSPEGQLKNLNSFDWFKWISWDSQKLYHKVTQRNHWAAFQSHCGHSPPSVTELNAWFFVLHLDPSAEIHRLLWATINGNYGSLSQSNWLDSSTRVDSFGSWTAPCKFFQKLLDFA